MKVFTDNKILFKYMPALLWSAFIFVACFIPGNELPKNDWLDKIHFDKIIHAGLYFVFYLLLARVTAQPARLVPALICFAQGILIECLQGSSWIRGRSFEAWDVVANVLGVLMAAWIMHPRGNSRP